MKPIIKFLKLTCAVEITVEDKKWVAKSDSLGMVASGESPEEALKNLEKEVQSTENKGAADRKNKIAKKAKEEKARLKKLAEEKALIEENEAKPEFDSVIGDSDESEEGSETGEESDTSSEQSVEDKDTEFDDDEGADGVEEQDLIGQIESGDIRALRDIADQLEVEHEGITKAPLRALLLEKVAGNEEE